MEIVKSCVGNKHHVWMFSKNYLCNESILFDKGEEWCEATLLPVSFSWKYWVHFIHTGAEAGVIITLVNMDSQCANANVIKGDNWDISSLIKVAAESVHQLFSEASFRQKRTILISIGHSAYKILGELNTNITTIDECERIDLKIIIDSYKHLLEVDWIEDVLDNRYYKSETQ